MKHLDNLKIAGKVALSSGSILVLFLISSAMAIWGLTTARTGFADYRSLTAQTNGASRVQAELHAASIGVKDFIDRKSVVSGKSGSVRVDPRCRRIIHNKKSINRLPIQ